MKTVRIGIIGSGGMAGARAEHILKEPGYEVPVFSRLGEESRRSTLAGRSPPGD